MCTVDATCPTGPSWIKELFPLAAGDWLLMAHNSVPLQELSWAGGYPLPWGQPASKNTQTVCLSVEQLWRIIPAPKLCVGSTEVSPPLHCGSPSPFAFPSAFLTRGKCCSPEHPVMKLPSKNVRIRSVCFPGTWPLTLPNEIRRSRGAKNVFILVYYHSCTLPGTYRMVSQKLTRCSIYLYILLPEMYREIKCIDLVEP